MGFKKEWEWWEGSVKNKEKFFPYSEKGLASIFYERGYRAGQDDAVKHFDRGAPDSGPEKPESKMATEVHAAYQKNPLEQECRKLTPKELKENLVLKIANESNCYDAKRWAETLELVQKYFISEFKPEKPEPNKAANDHRDKENKPTPDETSKPCGKIFIPIIENILGHIGNSQSGGEAKSWVDVLFKVQEYLDRKRNLFKFEVDPGLPKDFYKVQLGEPYIPCPDCQSKTPGKAFRVTEDGKCQTCGERIR